MCIALHDAHDFHYSGVDIILSLSEFIVNVCLGVRQAQIAKVLEH